MTATVERTRNSQYAYQAYCPACKDGMNGSKILCNRWAARHNRDKHPGESAEEPA